MSKRVGRRRALVGKAAIAALAAAFCVGGELDASAQAVNNPAPSVQVPQIVVTAPKNKPKPKPKPVARRIEPASSAPATANNGPTPAQAALDSKMTGLDQARANLIPSIGASTSTITRS